MAVATLAEYGYRESTMLEVARRASASKETLYAWFGSKPGLFQAVIRRNAGSVRAVLETHLDGDAPISAPRSPGCCSAKARLRSTGRRFPRRARRPSSPAC